MLARIPLLFLLLSILFNGSSAFPRDIQVQDSDPSSDKISAKINDAFDMSLPGIRKLLYDMGADPYQLRDFHHHLTGILIQNGEIDLINGWVQGMTNIVRAGDVVLSYEKNLLTLDMMLGLDVAEIECDYLFKYGLIKRKGGAVARVSNLVAQTVVSFDMGKHKLRTDFVKVISASDIDIKLEGHTLDPLLDVVIKGITILFRQHVMKVMEEGYKLIFEQLMDDVNEKMELSNRLYESDNVLDNVPAAFAFRNLVKFDNTMRND